MAEANAAALEADDAADLTDTGGTDTATNEADTASPEDKALRMGWVPKDQFKGDPEKWTDAATFIKRGDEFLPFLKANNRKLETALSKATKRLEEMESTLKEFGEFHSKTAKREYERAMVDLQAQQDAATAAGDVEGVRATTAEITKLTAEIAKPVETKTDDAPKGPPAAWLDENPWYATDEVMAAAAGAICAKFAATGMAHDEQLRQTAKRIREEFPHKFENPRRREAAAVEGGTARGGKAGKGYGDLPPGAQAACDRFVRQGLITRDAYVKTYDWEKA